MGFYAPAQIVRDARDHGVEVRPVDINHSDWDCRLEPPAAGTEPALRLGFRQVSGLAQAEVKTLVAARAAGNARPFCDAEDLWRRAGLSTRALECLARGDAFGSAGLVRRQALWAVRRLGQPLLPLFAESGESGPEPAVTLPPMAPGEAVSQDYASLRLSLKAHPLALLRDELTREGAIPAARLGALAPGTPVTIAGLAITRQRPGTASGVIFITLEDESGIANLIVWPKLFERYRRETLGARLLLVTGELQREGIVIHVIVRRMRDLTNRLLALADPELFATLSGTGHIMYPSRDFH
jgi:error-prone DNA polymerase